MFGKTIELFLVNGSAEGIITAELSNWNGKSIKIPRTDILQCEREDIKGTGIYFLFGQEEDGTNSVYIGEAECIIDRLKQHLRDYQSGKEGYYWTTAVTFVGRDLNKALIRYLEHKIVNLARECGKYCILTKNTYSKTVLKESEISSMEEFIENIKILISTLGYDVLSSTPQATSTTNYLFCKGAGADAKGFLSSNGLTVLKGSKVSDNTVPSLETKGKTYYLLRKRLENDGIIENHIFNRDYEFKAPSAASAVVLGRTSNGNNDWKDSSGKKLKDL